MVVLQKHIIAPDGELDNNSPSSILNNPDSLEEFAGLIQSLKESNSTEQEIKDEVRTFLSGKKNSINEKNNPFLLTYMFLDMIQINTYLH